MSAVGPCPGPCSVSISVASSKLRVEIGRNGVGLNGNLRQLEKLLVDASTTARRLETDLPSALAARDEAALRHSRASRVPLSVLVPGRSTRLRGVLGAAERKLQALATQRNACAVGVRFALGRAALDAFPHLAAAHAMLARAARIWDVSPNPLSGTMGAADGAPARVLMAAVPVLPEYLVSCWPGLALQDRDGAGIAVFPGFILMHRGASTDSIALTDLLEAQVEASEVRIAERECLPPDASVVDHTWERVNRDGSPDRRYANNPRIPIVAYGQLQLTLSTDNRRAYLVSNVAAASRFAEALGAFQAALRASSCAGPADAQGRDAWPDGEPEPIVRVPVPPRASGAHELTAALAVAIGLIGWSLSAPTLQASLPQVGDAIPPALPLPEPNPSAGQVPLPAHVDPAPVVEPAPVPVQPAAVSQESEKPVHAEPVRTAPQPPPIRRDQVVMRSGANVRAGPSGTADVVRKVPPGMRLAVFSRGPSGWVQVGAAAPWGWVHSSLLDAAE